MANNKRSTDNPYGEAPKNEETAETEGVPSAAAAATGAGKPFSQPRYQPGPLGAAPKGSTPYGLSQADLNKMSRGAYEDLLHQAQGAWQKGDKSAFAKPQNLLSRTGAAARRALAPAARVAGRAFPYAAGGMALYDAYKRATSPGFAMAAVRALGGEEAAYNMWAEQRAETGVTVPTYEEFKAHQATMEDPDGK